MKTILFLGRKEDEEAFSKLINGHQELQISAPSNARKLAKFLKTKTPDFILLAGQIRQNQDGKFTIVV